MRLVEQLLHGCRHFDHASARHVQGFGGCKRKIEHAPLGERPAVIDRNDDAAMSVLVGDAEESAKRQRAVGAGEFRRIVRSAGSSLASVIFAVIGSQPREFPRIMPMGWPADKRTGESEADDHPGFPSGESVAHWRLVRL
jgi:hypothetical protein